MSNTIIDWPRRMISGMLIGYLTSPSPHYHTFSTTTSQALRAVLKRGDVLLVEGNQRFSTAVKYLTQSTWSHAAMYVGESATESTSDNEPLSLIEADLKEGVASAPLSKYDGFNTRICRPIGLSQTATETVALFMTNRLGHKYDLRNVVDDDNKVRCKSQKQIMHSRPEQSHEGCHESCAYTSAMLPPRIE